MERPAWLVGATVLVLGGCDLLLRQLLGWSGLVVIGIGVGIAASVIGSYIHDLLADPWERL